MDIFISYATKDKARIKSLADALSAAGWSVFWDRTIKAGENWQKVIGDELDRARCVVVAWSTASVQSDWVFQEANEGKERGVLIPVNLDEVKMPFGFRHIQSAKLMDWHGNPDNQGFKDLNAALVHKIGRPEKFPKLSSVNQEKPEPRPQSKRWIVFGLAVLWTAAILAAWFFQISPNHEEGKNISSPPVLVQPPQSRPIPSAAVAPQGASVAPMVTSPDLNPKAEPKPESKLEPKAEPKAEPAPGFDHKPKSIGKSKPASGRSDLDRLLREADRILNKQ